MGGIGKMSKCARCHSDRASKYKEKRKQLKERRITNSIDWHWTEKYGWLFTAKEQSLILPGEKK